MQCIDHHGVGVSLWSENKESEGVLCSFNSTSVRSRLELLGGGEGRDVIFDMKEYPLLMGLTQDMQTPLSPASSAYLTDRQTD